jgi:hypothetical protein
MKSIIHSEPGHSLSIRSDRHGKNLDRAFLKYFPCLPGGHIPQAYRVMAFFGFVVAPEAKVFPSGVNAIQLVVKPRKPERRPRL